MTVGATSTFFWMDQARTEISRIQADMAELQRQTATGRKVNELRDAGAGASAALNAAAMLSSTEARLTALKELDGRFAIQDVSMQRVSESASTLLQQLRDMIANNSGVNLPEMVDHAFNEAKGALNATWAGLPVFGGEQISQPPISAADVAALAALPSVADAFEVSNRPQTIDLGEGVIIQMTPRANDLGGSYFDVLRDLKQLIDANGGALNTPLTAAQRTALQAIIPALDTARQSIVEQQGAHGEVWKQVDRESVRLQQRSDYLTKALGDQVDANMAEVAMKLAQAEAQFQASARTFNTLREMSLLNFLSR
jgi:flagellar hook-associated protein 3 FlgL